MTIVSSPVAEQSVESGSSPSIAGRVTPLHVASDPFAAFESARTAKGGNERSLRATGDLEVAFFDGPVYPSEPELDEAQLQRVRAIWSDGARRRRAELARYVIGAVGFSLVVCIAALIKAALPSSDVSLHEAAVTADAPVANAQSAAPAPLGVKPAPAAEVALANGTSSTWQADTTSSLPPQGRAPAFGRLDAVPAAAGVAARAPVPAAAGVAAAAPVPAAAGVAVAAPVPAAAGVAAGAPVPAAALKESSRRALEHGQMVASIQEGERAVSLDPADGEAWLILGAAYQQQGRLADARRCYRACVQQGKRGPVRECSAMLH